MRIAGDTEKSKSLEEAFVEGQAVELAPIVSEINCCKFCNKGYLLKKIIPNKTKILF